jgi:hypothetical protein
LVFTRHPGACWDILHQVAAHCHIKHLLPTRQIPNSVFIHCHKVPPAERQLEFVAFVINPAQATDASPHRKNPVDIHAGQR